MRGPTFRFTFEVQAQNAAPEDVIAMLQRVAEVVGKKAIQVVVPGTMASLPATAMRPELPGGGLLPALPPALGRTAYQGTWRMMTNVEKRLLLKEALDAEDWIVDRAAARLKMSRATVSHWMKVLGLRKPEAA